MRWRDQRQSSNVEDRRGGGGGMAVGGGVGGIIIALLVYLLGGDPGTLDQIVPPPSESRPAGQAASPEEEELASFVRVVLAGTEDVWKAEFQEMGRTYVEPTLVLFTNQVQSACGRAGASMGPFYRPPDQKVYIDLSFYRTLKQQLGAPGDLAQAYVIAHEV